MYIYCCNEDLIMTTYLLASYLIWEVAYGKRQEIYFTWPSGPWL